MKAFQNVSSCNHTINNFVGPFCRPIIIFKMIKLEAFVVRKEKNIKKEPYVLIEDMIKLTGRNWNEKRWNIKNASKPCK